jgi:RNA recognition motif-containing protein
MKSALMSGREGDRTTVLVGNLNYAVNEPQLRAELEKYAEIVSIELPLRRNRPAGLAIVRVKSSTDGTAIYEALTEQVFKGRKCYITFGVSRDQARRPRRDRDRREGSERHSRDRTDSPPRRRRRHESSDSDYSPPRRSHSRGRDHDSGRDRSRRRDSPSPPPRRRSRREYSSDYSD